MAVAYYIGTFLWSDIFAGCSMNSQFPSGGSSPDTWSASEGALTPAVHSRGEYSFIQNPPYLSPIISLDIQSAIGEGTK